jgi:hypothetical protein
MLHRGDIFLFLLTREAAAQYLATGNDRVKGIERCGLSVQETNSFLSYFFRVPAHAHENQMADTSGLSLRFLSQLQLCLI